MIERESRLTLMGQKRFTVSPKPPTDLVGAVRLTVKPGGLRENSIDVPGQDGMTRTVLGYADAEITAEIHIWDEGQMANVKRLAELFRPKRTQKTFEPVQIVAPATERWGIRHVYIWEIREEPWRPDRGLVITLKMREWQQKAKRRTQGVKPIQAGGGGSGLPSGDFSFLEGRDIAQPPSKSGVKP